MHDAIKLLIRRDIIINMTNNKYLKILIIIILLVLFIGAIWHILSIPYGHAVFPFALFSGNSKHWDNYWTNFWQVIGAFLGILGSVFAVMYEFNRQKKIEDIKKEDQKNDTLEKITYEKQTTIIQGLYKLELETFRMDLPNIYKTWLHVLEELLFALNDFEKLKKKSGTLKKTENEEIMSPEVAYGALKTKINELRKT